MKAITYPYTLTSFGHTKSTSTESKIFIDRVLTLLSTRVGQRPMTPEYGTDIASALFENEDNFALACRAAINKAVALWIPEISITEINISEPNHDGECKISLTIELPNSNLTSINITSSYFGADGTISRTGA